VVLVAHNLSSSLVRSSLRIMSKDLHVQHKLKENLRREDLASPSRERIFEGMIARAQTISSPFILSLSCFEAKQFEK
jgi:hypothetical protein